MQLLLFFSSILLCLKQRHSTEILEWLKIFFYWNYCVLLILAAWFLYFELLWNWSQWPQLQGAKHVYIFIFLMGKDSVVVCPDTQSCLNLCNPMDHSLPDSSENGIFQARILEKVSISYSKREIFLTQGSNLRLVSYESCTNGLLLYHWCAWEAPL